MCMLIYLNVLSGLQHSVPRAMAMAIPFLYRSSLLQPIIVFLLAFILSSPALSLRVPASPLVLPYHNGPLLAGDQPIKLFITFYGDFSASERSTLTSFLSSLSASQIAHHRSLRSSFEPLLASAARSSALHTGPPTVAKWWSLTRGYADLKGKRVAQNVLLSGETVDNYSRGKSLGASDIVSLVESSVKKFPADSMSVYLVFTAADVFVEGFCMHSCGQHSYTKTSDATGGRKVPYAWVGNSKSQCPGFCAWPFAKLVYGPPVEPLKAPNEIGVDGMIVTLAKALAGAATNPFGNAYYKGDPTFSLEAGGACTSTFGAGAYPGYPGELLTDLTTGASYNMEGNGDKKFLVPWIWNPATRSCAGQP